MEDINNENIKLNKFLKTISDENENLIKLHQDSLIKYNNEKIKFNEINTNNENIIKEYKNIIYKLNLK